MLDPSPSNPVPFGRYLITERLGRGGMAEVFKGKLPGLDGFERTVCIKRILPELAEQEDFVRLLLDEARITVALHHPNIVQCLDLGKHEGVYFMAMEYIEGRDLQQLYDACEQRGIFFPFKHSLHVLGQTLEGLAYAQRARGPDGQPLDLVHRDLTPSNIFVSFEGDVKIGDFGVARASVMKRMETTGKTVGKLGYLSPEQVKGLELDGRSDIFSLGVTLFELLTRTPLFPGDDPDEVMELITKFDPVRTIEAHPTLPNDLADMLLKALAVDREDRYPNAQDFSEDLTDFLFNEGIRVGSRDLSEF
ncbi:MAG: serine/threonine-protein kinase, partial [Myxococcota bacterium]|nr:serine/threonine-protein kinase [Myxococcota bacterium]